MWETLELNLEGWGGDPLSDDGRWASHAADTAWVETQDHGIGQAIRHSTCFGVTEGGEGKGDKVRMEALDQVLSAFMNTVFASTTEPGKRSGLTAKSIPLLNDLFSIYHMRSTFSNSSHALTH